jgi:integrase
MLSKRHWRGTNPTVGWKAEAEPRRDFLYIPSDKFMTALRAAENPRDRARCAMGLFSFGRDSEVCAATWRQVHTRPDGKKTIVLNRKKTKTRDDLPQFELFTEELDAWKVLYQSTITQQGMTWSEDFPIIPKLHWGGIHNRYGVPADREMAPIVPERLVRSEHICQSVIANMGHPVEREGGHTFRRSGGAAYHTYLTKLGISEPTRIVMRLLGHTSMMTTEKYLNINADMDRMRQAVYSSGDFGREVEEPTEAVITTPVFVRPTLTIVRNVG